MRTHHRILLAIAAATAAGAFTLAVAMTNGTEIPDADESATGVVMLDIGHKGQLGPQLGWQTPGRCSGTMLSPTWLLTASHCLVPLVPEFGAGGVLDERTQRAFATGAPFATVWHRSSDPADQPDEGRFLVAGAIWDTVNHTALRPVVWAFDGRGTVPTVFGEDGDVTIPRLEGVANAGLTAVASLPGGDFVAAGWADVGDVEHVLVLRFSRDGFLRRTPFPAPASLGASPGFEAGPGQVRAIAVDAVTGDVVVAGSRTEDGLTRWLALRFDAGGELLAEYEYLADRAYAGTIHDVAVVGQQVVVLGALDQGASGSVPALAVLGDESSVAPVQVLSSWGTGAAPRRLAADGVGHVVAGGQNGDGTEMILSRHAVPSLAVDPDFGPEGVARRALDATDPRVHYTNLGVVDLEVDEAHRVVVAVDLLYSTGSSTVGVARFTAAGDADAGFGQGGFIYWHDDSLGIVNGTGLALASGQALVVGTDAPPMKPMAVLFKTADQEEVAPHFRARVGDAEAAIERVVRHPDPDVDVALVELKPWTVRQAAGDPSPAVPAPPPAVRVAGFVDATSLTRGQAIACYGYGEDASGDSGTLHRGELAFDSVVGNVVTAASVCSNAGGCPTIQGGDSGSGCFVEDQDDGRSWRQVGVNFGLALIGTRDAWHAEAARQFATRADVLTTWIQTTTGIELASPVAAPAAAAPSP